MPSALRKLLSSLFNQPQPVVAQVDPLVRFRSADGALAVTIQTCVLSDGSMLVKAPGLQGFAIGFKTPPDEEALKSIISTVFKQKLKLEFNMNEDDYIFELTSLSDKNGYSMRVQPKPVAPALVKPKL